ncbi:hypothetical protein D3C80_1189420 [compost metagenome]
MAHDRRDASITFFLPARYRVLLVPGHQQLLLLPRHAQLVPIEHVERGTRDQPFHFITWFSGLLLEVDLGGALPILRGNTRHHPVVEVAAVAIDFADGRIKIEQVGFHGPEDRIFIHAMFATAVLPTLALMTECPGGHNMFPLGALGTTLLFARFIAAGFGVDSAT